jgi:hypothetical protein
VQMSFPSHLVDEEEPREEEGRAAILRYIDIASSCGAGIAADKVQASSLRPYAFRPGLRI